MVRYSKEEEQIRSAMQRVEESIREKIPVGTKRKTGECKLLSIYLDIKRYGFDPDPETGDHRLSKRFRRILGKYRGKVLSSFPILFLLLLFCSVSLAYRPNYKIVDDKVEGDDLEEEEEEEEVPRTQKKVKSKSAPRVACVLPPAPVTAQEVSHKGLADGHVRHLDAKLDHLVELTVSLSSALNEARQEISSIGSALSNKGDDERTDHSLQTNAGTNNVGKSVSAFLFKFDGQMDGLQIKFDAQKELARVDDASLVNHDFLSGGGGDRGSVHQSNHN